MSHLYVIALAAALLIPDPGQDVPVAPQPRPAPAPEQKRLFAARDTAQREAEQAAEGGRVGETAAAAKRAVALEIEARGADDPAVAARAFWAQALDELAAARRQFPPDDWRAREARVEVREADRAARFTVAERRTFDTVQRLSGEGDQLAEAGLMAEAAGKIRAAIDACTGLLGEIHPRHANLLLDLGGVYYQARAFSKAEPLLRRAVAIRAAVYGESHPAHADALNALAVLCRNTNRLADARAAYEAAERITRESIGKDNWAYANLMANMANMYSDLGDYGRAGEVAREGVRLRRAIPDTRPDDLAVAVNNLAMVYRDTRRYADAEPLFVEAVALNRRGLRATHPDFAHSVHNLAANHFDKGERAKAGPLFREAVGVILAHLEASAAVQSEADQLAAGRRLRFYLNSMLFAADPADARVTYDLVYRARGAVTARQAFARAAAADDPAARALVEQLRDVARRMAGLAADPAAGRDAQAEYRRLAARRDDLEAELSGRSAAFRARRTARNGTVADLQKALPADSALVDFVQYHDRMMAFVITPGSVALVPLGGVNPIAEAVDGFRAELGRGGPADPASPAAFLRERVWAPVAARAQAARHFLVCPDGPLSRMPFAALPATDPARYLVEDVAVSVVPVPQLLTELLGRPAASGPPASLLVIGGVDYGSPASGAASPTRPTWSALPGAKVEADEVAKVFAAAAPRAGLTILGGAGATKAAVRAMLPERAAVHFATHGYFTAPPTALNQLVPQHRLGDVFRDPVREDGPDPGLLSGLVLAGANSPRGEDTGVLTALEVADLDLTGCELAVLSACETGLGVGTGGEGVLGLQRVFQVAGARSTVTSLWQVPDKATETLMVRFYRNMWVRKMARLDALREAQLWLLRDGRADAELDRGLQLVGAPPPAAAGRLPPHYWAAFVLGGDWR